MQMNLVPFWNVDNYLLQLEVPQKAEIAAYINS